MGRIPEITDYDERDFLDGVLEVYDELFSHKVPYYALDETASKINANGEVMHRVYKDPVYLTARVVIEPKDGEKAVNRDFNKVTIRVPTQNMFDNGLPVEADDLAKMRKGKFVWNGIDYQITRIKPKSMINDHHILHQFYCTELIEETDYRETVTTEPPTQAIRKEW